uniref:Endonuclease V n=1 Tax=Equus caballus TaxID=9796 RepID=A0A9L0TNT6_HORSE
MVSLTAPYVSGFLAFREVPFLVDAVRRLREKEPCLMPQVLLVDGNGVLHHRGFGVACHLGVLTDLPCVGVAKKLLQVDGLENNAQHKEKAPAFSAVEQGGESRAPSPCQSGQCPGHGSTRDGLGWDGVGCEHGLQAGWLCLGCGH